MKTSSSNKILLTVLALLLPVLANAALVTLKTADASGTTSFTGSTNWSNGAVPSSGNDYSTTTSVILNTSGMRTPADATTDTFAGNSLTLTFPGNGNYSILEKSSVAAGAGRTLIINNFTNAGGLIRSGGTVGGIITVTGSVYAVTANSTILADQCNWIFNSPMVGSGILTNNFASSQTLTFGGNDANFSGKILINGITLFSSQAAVPGNPVSFMPDQIILGSGGTLRDNIGINLNNANAGVTLYGAGTINTVNAVTNTTIGEPITGAFGLTKSGAGILTLSGSNSFSGGLTMSGATAGSQLNINSTNALGTGTFTVSGGDLSKLDNTSGAPLTNLANNAQSWGNNFSFIGSSSLNLGSGAVTLAANRVVTNLASTLTVGGSIGGAFSLTKIGAGTLVLPASNSFSGGLTISAGTVVMGNTNALGTNGMTFAGTGNATLDIVTDGADYTNVVNAGSSTTWTMASDVKTGSVGINHTLGTFLIGSGATPLQMNVVAGPNVLSGSPEISSALLTLSGGSGGTTILIPTTASISFGGATATATSKTLQLDGTNQNNSIIGPIADGVGGFVIMLVKTNTSTWTLSGANTYSGSTTIGQGTLALSGSGSIGSSNIFLGSAGTLNVSASSYVLGAGQTLNGSGTVVGSFSDSTGSQIVPGGAGSVGTLTFNGNLSLAAGDTNEFDFATGANDMYIITGSMTPALGSTINLASLPAGGLTNGTYTLMQVSGSLGGSAANFTITGKPSPSRQTFNIVYTAGTPNLVQLQVGGSPASLTWFGTSSAWDIVTTKDWTNAASLSTDYYFDGDNVSFTDLGSAISPVLNVNVQPGSVAFNSANAYTLSGSGSINGSAGLTKSGNGTLTIQNTNGCTGVTTLNGGTVSIASITNGGLASPLGAASSASANIVFNGGTLQYTTGDMPSTDRGATLNAGGGTVRVSSAAAVLTLNGVIAGSSGGGLTTSGNGTLVLNGANTYNGSTTIGAGVLQLGNGGATGNPGTGNIIDNTSLVALRTGTLTLSNNISGPGSLVNNGTGTLVLAATNTYLGETLINTGIVQVVSAHALGSAPAVFDPAHIFIGTELEASTNFSISDTNSGVSIPAGTIAVDSGVTLVISNQVASTNSLTKALPGTLILSGSNTFNGVLNIDTASQTASDGAVRVTTNTALGGVQTINVRNNQGPASSTLQIDGTYGEVDVVPATWTWSGRNNFVPAVENIAGNNVWNPGAVTLNVGGSYYTLQCDAGSLTLPGSFPTTAPATTRQMAFSGPGLFSITGNFQSGGDSGIGLFVTNNATVILWNGNSYNGLTSLQGGTLSAADGSSFGVSTTNIEIAPYTNEFATLNISNATVTAQRIIVAGVTANNTSPGTGIVNQVNGTVNASQWVTIGSGGTLGGTGTYNLSGGQLNVQNTAGGTQLEIANFTGSSGTLNISGSAILEIQNSAYIAMGANAGAGNGTVNQYGGTVTFYSDGGGTVGGNGILYLGKAASLPGTYTYNLDGGTLQVPTITSTTNNSLFYLNGGTLEAAETNASFISGLTAVYVSTNGATIDSSSYAVTIAQPLLHDPALGATPDRGLTNLSSGITGTLTLTATNTYTGPTVINSGALNINGSIGAGAVTINGGTLGGLGAVNGATTLVSGTNAPGGSGVIGTLTINNTLAIQGGTVQFDMNRSSNDVLAVSGAVNVSAPATILLSFPSPDVGTYTLITYGSLAGFGNLSLALASPNPRFGFSLVNNTGTKTVQVVVTGNSANLVWKGDGGFNGWDNAGAYQNWLNGASPDYFYDGDVVTFNNSGNDSAPINIQGTVSPGLVTVNATQNYDFANSGGSIGGAGGLTKGGSGTLTLEENNTYSGTTFITNGTIQVGNGAANGSLGSGVISNNASLIFDRSDTIVLPSPIYGSGSVTLADGNVTASSSNSYTGNTFVNSGDAFLANSSGFGATNGTISVASSAQVYITANVDFGANPLTLIGVGDGNGALRKGAAGTSTYNGAVTLTGDTSISVDGSATLNLASPSGINGSAANANLTLFGAGTGTVAGPLALGTGGLTVSAGTWTLGPANNFTGLTTLSGGTTRITGGSLGNPATFTANQITLGGGTLEAVTNAAFIDGNAGIILTANSTLIVDSGYTLTISNQISGGNNLTKSSPGTLVLNGSNPFSGTLYVDTSSTTASDGNLDIASPNALANVPVTPGTPTIIQRNNNGGSSTLQLDGTAGNITVAQDIQTSCRNTTAANFENLAGSNTLSGTIDVLQGGGAIYFQSDAGTLNIAGTVQYTGTLNGARTYNFTGAGNQLVSGVITGPVNTNAPINVTMSGTGTLTLANANTYSNATIVSSGLMLVNGSITSTGGVTVNGGTLGGTGAINDVVSVGTGGTLSPGANGIGTLTITSNLTLSGTTYIEVNKLAGTRDQIVGVNTLTYGGTLFATNLAGTSILGDNYTIFSAVGHSGTFAGITGSPGANLAWSFNPTNGVLSVVNGINSTPGPIAFTVSGNTLTLSWSNHLGWILQSQTNSLGVGLYTNWVDVAGSSSVTQTNFTMNPAKPTTFYRLRLP